GTGDALHWKGGSSAQKLVVQGRLAGTDNWLSYNAASTTLGYTITGLAPGKKYQWRIAAVCQNVPLIMSDYSAVQEFTTLTAPGLRNTADENGLALTLSPNPAQDATTLTIKNAKGNVTVQVISLWGKTLWTHLAGKNTSVSIPVSSLERGTFVISANDGTQSKTVRLIKAE
ncbi:MAG: T9SS type A sorting domain-containing protein, partial [Sphingobacteriaceae bacterium]